MIARFMVNMLKNKRWMFWFILGTSMYFLSGPISSRVPLAELFDTVLASGGMILASTAIIYGTDCHGPIVRMWKFGKAESERNSRDLQA